MKNYGWGSANLKREIISVKIGQNEGMIEFANGSWIQVVTASDSGRGKRANILIIVLSGYMETYSCNSAKSAKAK